MLICILLKIERKNKPLTVSIPYLRKIRQKETDVNSTMSPRGKEYKNVNLVPLITTMAFVRKKMDHTAIIIGDPLIPFESKENMYRNVVNFQLGLDKTAM